MFYYVTKGKVLLEVAEENILTADDEFKKVFGVDVTRLPHVIVTRDSWCARPVIEYHGPVVELDEAKELIKPKKA